MPSKSHHRKQSSYGSKSLLSGNLWRSIGRGRSRSEMELSSPNINLSKAQNNCHIAATEIPPLKSQGATQTYCKHPSAVHASTTTSLHNIDVNSDVKPMPDSAKKIVRTTKRNPLSWLWLSRQKSQLPEYYNPMALLPLQSSMSSLPESTIGSPVLESTTNARVADSENVSHSDILLPDYAPITDDICREAAVKSKLQHSTINNSPKEISSTWTAAVRSVKKKLSHTRRASTSLLLETPWFQHILSKREHPAVSVQNFEHQIGSTKVLSKGFCQTAFSGSHTSISTSAIAPRALTIDRDVTASTYNDMLTAQNTRRLPCLPYLQSGDLTDPFNHSLSKSFANAFNGLDLQSSPTLVHDDTPVSRLQKAKSYLSLPKFSRDNSGCNLDHGLPVQATFADPILCQQRDTQQEKSSPHTKQNSETAQKVKIGSSHAMQLKFANKKRRYVKSRADHKVPENVNPLRMHVEVNAFAKSTANQAGPTCTMLRTSDDREEWAGIERAIIYSPSTDDLSEYSRTPSPVIARMVREPQETPSKKPVRSTSRYMLKRSVSSFFGKSASMMRLSSFTPSKKSSLEEELAANSKHTSLSEGHNFAQVNNLSKEHRKRSMSTPDMHAHDGLRAVWDYQPYTPSPLRKSTRTNTVSEGRQRAATTTTPVRVPGEEFALSRTQRDQINSDSEKRYGMYIPPSPAKEICRTDSELF